MTNEAMAAMPEFQAGQYTDAWWFKMFVAMLDAKFPGAGEWITKAAEFLPWAKLMSAVVEAVKDWQAGKDFFTILKEALADWVAIDDSTPGPIRMMAKPE